MSKYANVYHKDGTLFKSNQKADEFYYRNQAKYEFRCPNSECNALMTIVNYDGHYHFRSITEHISNCPYDLSNDKSSQNRTGVPRVSGSIFKDARSSKLSSTKSESNADTEEFVFKRISGKNSSASPDLRNVSDFVNYIYSSNIEFDKINLEAFDSSKKTMVKDILIRSDLVKHYRQSSIKGIKLLWNPKRLKDFPSPNKNWFILSENIPDKLIDEYPPSKFALEFYSKDTKSAFFDFINSIKRNPNTKSPEEYIIILGNWDKIVVDGEVYYHSIISKKCFIKKSFYE